MCSQRYTKFQINLFCKSSSILQNKNWHVETQYQHLYIIYEVGIRFLDVFKFSKVIH